MHPHQANLSHDAMSPFADCPHAGAGNDVLFVLERRWLPDAEGALTRRIACTNVPHLVVGFSTRGFDWGNSGPRAQELALNLLECVLRRMGHGGPRSRVLEGTCFTLALHLTARFAGAFLAAMPEEGGTIPRPEVEGWIAREIDTLDPFQRAMLAPRYVLEEGDPEEHWSLAELEDILGERLHPQGGGLYTATERCVARLVQPHPLDAADWESHPL